MIISTGAIVYVFVKNQYTFISYLGLVCGFLVLIGSLIIFLSDIKKGVKFDNTSIRIEADTADKKGLLVRRFQHQININYDEIEDIELVSSNKDSYGNTIENVFVKMPNIVFKCKDGKQKAINVYYYNNKQKIMIINEVKKRAMRIGNELKIESGEDLWKKYLQKNK